MVLVDFYIKWKIARELKAWTKFKNTHFYIDKKGNVIQVTE